MPPRLDVSDAWVHPVLYLRTFATAHWRLGRAYMQQRHYEEASAELRRAIDLEGRSPVFLSALGHVYGVAGQRAEALKLLGELKEIARKRYVFPHQIATIYIGLGQKEDALTWLERAYEERSNAMIALKVEPIYDVLRDERRFQDLLRRMRL